MVMQGHKVLLEGKEGISMNRDAQNMRDGYSELNSGFSDGSQASVKPGHSIMGDTIPSNNVAAGQTDY